MIKKFALASMLTYSLYSLQTPQQKKDLQGLTHGFTNSFSAMQMVLLSLYDYQVDLQKYPYNSEEYHAHRSIIHQRVADRILQLSIQNKGVYLKAGQYIGNLERVMPREFTQTLKVLQDQGPQADYEDIRIVLEDELKGKVEDLFSHFEEKAIAAASLAQVHRGKLLKTGQDVAVKVQFPWLRTQYRYDLIIIHQIARFCDYVVSFSQDNELNFAELFNTFRVSLEKELDFRLEAKNGILTAQQFKGNESIYIPKYYESTQRVLIMEFIDGVKINEINKLANPKECAHILIDLFSEMIFKHGHVHCDAHPGNILIRTQNKKTQLVLLDHGFYTDIDQQTLQYFRMMWINIAKFNYKEVEKYAKLLGIKQEHIEFLPLIFFFRTIHSKKKLGDAFSKEERTYVRSKDMITLQNINGLLRSMPPEIMFVIRAANLVGIHNAMLGGTTRERLLKFTHQAVNEAYPGSYFEWAKIKVFLFFFEIFGFIMRL